MKKLTRYAFVLFAFPAIVLAQNVQSALDDIQQILNALIPILITLAVIYFFWGLAQYILKSGDEEAQKEGRNKMIWGIIALFVMVSIWGLIGLIGETFGIDQGGTGDNFIPSV